MASRTILVIEDDPDIAQLVHLHLSDTGYEVDIVQDGAAGLQQALAKPYDLIILDLMLPGINGLDLCRKLRASSKYSLVLMVTAKSTELDRVLGLEVGADDYLTKPFSILELLARVKALFRRMDALMTQASPQGKKTIRAGELTIDVEKRKVALRGKAVDLTAKNSTCCFSLLNTPDRSIPAPNCWTSCGAMHTKAMNTPLTPTSTGSGPRSNRTPVILGTFSRSGGVGYSFSEEWACE